MKIYNIESAKNNIALEMYKLMLRENIIYTFMGKFHYSTINFILSDLKGLLSIQEVNLNSSRKTYRIIVECLENAHKHSIKSTLDADGILVVSKIINGFKIQIGNLIEKRELKELINRVEVVNSKNSDELKIFYKESIMKSKISDKGGAGIGLIDIALKSENKINYYYNKHEDDSYFFVLEIFITNGKL